VPKLFVDADPGAILVGAQREFCRSWPNQTEVRVRGNHFLQEDSPDEIGRAVADWLAARSPSRTRGVRNQNTRARTPVAEPSSATRGAQRCGLARRDRRERGPRERHRGELTELDADVEAEQRRREARGGQLHLREHTGEAEAVHEPEHERHAARSRAGRARRASRAK
jgi:hypothetical protein